MRPFDYSAPKTLQEAAGLLQEWGNQASVLAGGTDLLVEMKDHRRSPACLIDLKKIAGLDYVTYDEACGLRIGALATARQVETCPAVRQHYPALFEAVSNLASWQVRNRATIAGNICRASPSADTPPPLLVADAAVTIFGSGGMRSLPLAEFFTGPGRTVLAPGEILVEIAMPAPPRETGATYIKHGRRSAMELATVGVAVALTFDGVTCVRARVALGAVAPTPIRVPQAEAALEGTTVDEGAIDRAARAAVEAARPISDVRSSAAYRREMVGVLTGRAVRAALARAR